MGRGANGDAMQDHRDAMARSFFRACFVCTAVLVTLLVIATRFDTEPVAVVVCAAAILLFDCVCFWRDRRHDGTRGTANPLAVAFVIAMCVGALNAVALAYRPSTATIEWDGVTYKASRRPLETPSEFASRIVDDAEALERR